MKVRVVFEMAGKKVDEIVTGTSADDLLSQAKSRVAKELGWKGMFLNPMSPLQFAQTAVRMYNERFKTQYASPQSAPISSSSVSKWGISRFLNHKCHVMKNYTSDSDKLALFPLRMVLFPYVSIPLHIFEERYKAMIARCLDHCEPFGIVLTEPAAGENNAVAVHTTGTLARIEQSELLEDGRYNIMVRGESRFIIDNIYNDAPYLTATVRPVWDTGDEPINVQRVFDEARELFKDYLSLQYQDAALPDFQLLHDAEFLSYAIPAVLQIDLAEKQQQLAVASAKARLQQSVEILKRELNALKSASTDEPEAGDGEFKNRRTISLLDTSYAQDYFSRS